MSIGESIVGNLVATLVLNTKSFDASVDPVKKKLTEIGGALTGVGVVTGKVAKSAVQSAAEFETAFVGVTKTVNAPAGVDENEFFSGLRQGILDMSEELPVAASEIAGVYQAAGQLGIRSENLEGFSRAMLQLSSATNLTSEEASTSLAQFANVMGTDQTLFENMGSSIVALGNNFATNERQIVNFAQELGIAGKLAGMNEAEILGFGTAMASLGLDAAASGTAFQRFTQMVTTAVASGNDDLDVLAAVSGKSAEEFQQQWGEDASGALTSFLEGLGGLSSAEQIGVFDELDVNQQREITMLQSLATNTDLVKDALTMSNTAWEENTALTTEADKAVNTTNSQMQILNNNLTELGITLGDSLLPTVNKILDALKPIIDDVTKFIADHPKLTSGIIGIGLALGLVGSIMTAVMPIIIAFNAGLITINAPVIAVAAGIIGLITIFALLADTIFEADENVRAFNGDINSVNTSTETLTQNGYGELVVEGYKYAPQLIEDESGDFVEVMARYDEATQTWIADYDQYKETITQTTDAISGMNTELVDNAENLTTTTENLTESKSVTEQAQEVLQGMQEAYEGLTDSGTTNTAEMETSLATINDLLNSETYKQLAENPVEAGVLTSWEGLNDALESVAGNLGDVEASSISDTLGSMADSAKSAAAAFRQLADEIRRAMSLGGSGGSPAGGNGHSVVEMRAGGGSVTGNHPYIVGEEGAELYVPKANGYIVPNDELQDLFGGRITVNVGNVYGESYLRDYVIETMTGAIRQEMRLGS